MKKQTAILEKIEDMERELQELKIQFYFSFPKKKIPPSIYSEKNLLESAKAARERIWKSQYAKKIARLS